jgi:antitoxin component of MazEF toxin-antitoxin module
MLAHHKALCRHENSAAMALPNSTVIALELRYDKALNMSPSPEHA